MANHESLPLSPDARRRINEIVAEDQQVPAEMVEVADTPRYVFPMDSPFGRGVGDDVLVSNGFDTIPGIVIRSFENCCLVEVLDGIEVLVHESHAAWIDYRDKPSTKDNIEEQGSG